MAQNKVILQVQDVTMQFGGLRAIDSVSFHVDEAEIFGLIGPNGAGKTTMFNVITANYKPTSGSVTLAGKSLKGLKPNRVVNAGIARTFQNIRLFNSMTVLENVMVGLDSASRYSLLEAALHIGRYFPPSGRQRPKRWRFWTISVSPISPTCRPPTSATATSARWRSPARWRRRQNCCCSTSPPPG
jgi:branched-chain amino acid transport system ATP-binding protein